MIVNSLTSGFMYMGEPVANGYLAVFDRKEEPREYVQLYVDGEPKYNKPVQLNKNGRILEPVETKLNSVYCEVWNSIAQKLFGFELSGSGAFLQFVPNSLNPESTGVTDKGKIAIKDSASLALSGETRIDLGGSAKLLARGAGAISGLQGIIGTSNVLEENARAYSLTGNFSFNDELFAEARDSFLDGDAFYFIAEENDIVVSYFGTNGELQNDLLRKGEALTLILAEKNDNELLFRKLASTRDVALVKELISYTDVKLSKEITSREEEYESLREEIDKLFNGEWNQVRLGDGQLTTYSVSYNAASSLFADSISDDAPDYLYGEFDWKGEKMEWEKIVNLIFIEIYQRLLDDPNFGGGGGGSVPGNFIDSVTITITTPVNGMAMSEIASIADGSTAYWAGDISWTPQHDIANATYRYIGVFTVNPYFPNQFHPRTPITVNGSNPTRSELQSDWSIRITMSFPATMTALVQPVLTIPEPIFGGNIPTSATQVDSDSVNYTSSIEWRLDNSLSTISGTFPEGVFTGTFTLTAAEGHRWNSAVVTLNGNVIPSNDVHLSDDGMTLTFEYQTEELLDNYFIDSRDGRRYRTVRIGNQIWMAENLNWNGSIGGTTSGAGANTKGVYYNTTANATTGGSVEPFAKAGRLYTYAEALTVAPPGYHLPSYAEWDTLFTSIGGYMTAGLKLKSRNSEQPSQAHWNLRGNGTPGEGTEVLPLEAV